MDVPVTFRDQTENECGKDKQNDSLFRRSQAEPLPDLIKFGVLLQPVLSIATELSH